MSTTPVVTYEDLRVIELLEGRPSEWSNADAVLVEEFTRRLRAAAEADRPPLPEGWVLLDGDDGSKYPYWHEDNRLYSGRGGDAYKLEATAASMRDRLTPLRPTVTEADVEKAARAARAVYFDSADHGPETQRVLDGWMKITRAAFKAAGIEVTP